MTYQEQRGIYRRLLDNPDKFSVTDVGICDINIEHKCSGCIFYVGKDVRFCRSTKRAVMRVWRKWDKIGTMMELLE